MTETRVKYLEPREEKMKSSTAHKKNKDKSSLKKKNLDDSNSSIVESSEESTLDRWTIMKYYILHKKCIHNTYKYIDLFSLISKNKQKNEEKLHIIHSGQERAKCYNQEENSKVCWKQHKEKKWERATIFPETADFRQWQW